MLATTFIGPTLGVLLDRRGHRAGLAVFTVSMLSAFLLGVVLHFVVESPDHVHAVPPDPWRLPFQVTAVAVAATPALGTAVGVWLSRRRGPA